MTDSIQRDPLLERLARKARTVEEALSRLKAAGASPVLAILSLHHGRGLSLGDAKAALLASTSWTGETEGAAGVIDRMIEARGGRDVGLPAFTYHPDPIATGSIVASDTACACCGEARGWVYAYCPAGEKDYEACICPWCIADGSARERLEVEFTDRWGIGGFREEWDAVSDAVKDEIAHRTPGFVAWQSEMWWTHCGDAAQFLGPAGKKELDALGPEAIEGIRVGSGDGDRTDWPDILDMMDRDIGPTAYVFRCRTCGAYGGYWDCH